MASDVPLPPDFIRFLLSSKPKFDCYFAVKTEGQEQPERIGAVKLMLMAHSEVFRLELEDSELAEKKDVLVKDIHPETFKGMLRYVYGYDTTAEMDFDEADNLLYVAEKYMMKTFKDKLATKLMELLNVDNICSLLNNPACYTHLELDSAITQILRHNTDQVLASPQFLCMNTDCFLKILEQDGLAVREIELWRAAIKWAKHRANSEDGTVVRQQLSGLTQYLRLRTMDANSEDGPVVRQQLSGLTQHLRLRTMDAEDLCEVISSDVLEKSEIKTVCINRLRVRTEEELEELNDFSNETKPRSILPNTAKHGIMTFPFEPALGSGTDENEYCLTLVTNHHCIELLPLVCKSIGDHMSGTYKVDCKTTVRKENNPNNREDSSTNDSSIVSTFSQFVKYGVEFEIPLAVDGRNITLQPDTKYTVEVEVNGWHKYYISNISSSSIHVKNEYLSMCHSAVGINIRGGYTYYFPFKFLQFRVAK